jgi:hypothetical protein
VDSSVTLATRLRTGRPGDRGSKPGWSKGFRLLHSVHTSSGAYLASYPMGTGVFSPGVKRQEREADNSCLSNVYVQNVQSYTSIPPYVFMAWCLIHSTGKLHPCYVDLFIISRLYATFAAHLISLDQLPVTTLGTENEQRMVSSSCCFL